MRKKKPEQKYKNGSTVWIVKDGEYVMELTVYKALSSNHISEYVYTFIGHPQLSECDLFPDERSANVELRLRELERVKEREDGERLRDTLNEKYLKSYPCEFKGDTKKYEKYEISWVAIFFLVGLIFGAGFVIGKFL